MARLENDDNRFTLSSVQTAQMWFTSRIVIDSHDARKKNVAFCIVLQQRVPHWRSYRVSPESPHWFAVKECCKTCKCCWPFLSHVAADEIWSLHFTLRPQFPLYRFCHSATRVSKKLWMCKCLFRSSHDFGLAFSDIHCLNLFSGATNWDTDFGNGQSHLLSGSFESRLSDIRS